jgi:demethylmenaquinone methyltransferase/2-methoxy-6-polyprenyl-1,4-benzoquinol methylase
MKNYPPVGTVKGKKQRIEAMFDAIAPHYDRLNRILSLGIDQRWRRQAVEMLRPFQPKRILDVATGTADLAIEAMQLRPEKIVGVDIAEEMLERGRTKLATLGYTDTIALRRGDAERLPFSDAQFDAVMVAFGVRNFEDLEGGLREIRRVLKPGGQIIVLEFSRPRVFPIRQLYAFYSRYVLPRLGQAVSKDEGAYQYLPDSIAAFPDGPDFQAVLEKTGYSDTRWKPLTFGIASLYQATA